MQRQENIALDVTEAGVEPAHRRERVPRVASSGPIHIFNGFKHPHGGSDTEALELYRQLSGRAEAYLWTTSSRVSRELMERYPIRRILRQKRQYPRGGTYAFIGPHWRGKLWPYLIAKPRRLIYQFNTFHPKAVRLTESMPRLLGWPPPERVVVSEFQNRMSGLRARVHPSPIDIRRFSPTRRPTRDEPIIGRLTRDQLSKHHPEDIHIYRHIVARGWELRLQGAASISDRLPASTRLHLYEEGVMPPEQFLPALDIFYYRTSEHLVETFGRVVVEAMACGLPVVCHHHGGYSDLIGHGENGFLFDSTEEARAIIDTLAEDPDLRARIGANARRTVEALYSEAEMERRLAFYLA